MQHVLQWPSALLYVNVATHTLLNQLFRPFVIRIDNKANHLLKFAVDLYQSIALCPSA
jgi:hypothetical protein